MNVAISANQFLNSSYYRLVFLPLAFSLTSIDMNNCDFKKLENISQLRLERLCLIDFGLSVQQ